jgi:hypothetical protein
MSISDTSGEDWTRARYENLDPGTSGGSGQGPRREDPGRVSDPGPPAPPSRPPADQLPRRQEPRPSQPPPPAQPISDDVWRRAGDAARQTGEIIAEPIQGERPCTKWIFRTIWRTAADERVCPECGPLDGVIHQFGVGPSAPLHIGCRCWREYYDSVCVDRGGASGDPTNTRSGGG